MTQSPEVDPSGSKMSRLFQLKYKDLQSLTDDFSEENLIYHAQFCKLYRGKIPIYCGGVQFDCREVTVKVWVEEAITFEDRRAQNTWDQNLENFNDEITLLGHDSTLSCPNLPKLLAFCRENETEQLGVVYDLKPLDVLQNLFHEDTFNWCQRIKVALGVARVLKHFHGNQPQCLIRDLSAAHVMIDRNYNPILFNFFGLTGGIIGEKTEILNRSKLGSWRYLTNGRSDWKVYYDRMDVYAFGVILWELLRKCVVGVANEPQFKSFEHGGDLLLIMYRHKKSKLFSRAKKCSLAHMSFHKDADFDVHDAYTMTDLAMLCRDPKFPTAEQIVETLKSMRVVKKNIWMFRE